MRRSSAFVPFFFTVVSMTLSLVAVLIPILFLGGIVGRLFREFAGTATVAILISGLVSLTLTPVLCGKWLRPQDVRLSDGRPERGFHARSAQLFERILATYRRGLEWSLTHSRLVLGGLTFIMLLTVSLYVVIPNGFFPQQDNGLIAGVTEAAPDISYASMVARMRVLADRVRQDPAIQYVYFWVEGNPSTNIGRMLIDLKSFSERNDSVYTVIRRIKERVLDLSDISIHLQARQDLTVGARVSKTQFQYRLRDPDLAELQHWAPLDY